MPLLVVSCQFLFMSHCKWMFGEKKMAKRGKMVLKIGNWGIKFEAG